MLRLNQIFQNLYRKLLFKTNNRKKLFKDDLFLRKKKTLDLKKNKEKNFNLFFFFIRNFFNFFNFFL